MRSEGQTESFVGKSSVVSYNLKNVVLSEWDIVNDRPLPGGRCLRADKLQLSGVP